MKNAIFQNLLKQHNQEKKAMGGFNFAYFLYFLFSVGVFCVVGAKAQNLDVPFVPTSEKVVELMLDVVNVGPGDYVIDLGSGDGRIVIAAAKRGAVGHGIDIDPKRINEARNNAAKQGVDKNVLFKQEDLFKTDYSRASVVTMYLLNSVNLKLRPHLLKNLRPGTRIVSHDFDMDDWKPDKHMQEGYSDVFYWVIPANAEGNWNWKANGNSFSMNVKQKFQEIEVNARQGNSNLKIEDSNLSGERIRFTAINSSNGLRYVYSGRINEGNIEGIVQIRNGDDAVIEQWNARRN